MTGGENKTGRSLSRREFAGKSILVIAAACTAGLAGYAAFNSKKIRTINNVHRIGHCAPSIIQTLLDINNIQDRNLVLYAGALAGGIAGANTECGVLTAPLMFIGFQTKDFGSNSTKLDIISRAQSYINEFIVHNGTSVCSKIRCNGIQACRRVMYNFHELYARAISAPVNFSDETKASYSFLLQTFDENKFHCAHNVLDLLSEKLPVTREMLDSAWLFIGGIAMLNRTCGALAAGVIALSSATAKMENSYSRVAKMNRLLRQENTKAMDVDINNFNRSINLSDELGAWFLKEFGSTSCYDIWGYNFSRIKDAESYISGQCMRQCRYIAQKVAEQVTMRI